MHSFSVVIPTRGRPFQLRRALAALQECQYPTFEVIVVIDGEDSEPDPRRLEDVLPRARLEYVRVPRRGAAAARNAGLRHAQGEFVAFTDDDCTVPGDWLGRIEQRLLETPEPGLVCGALHAAPHDPAHDYIPVFEPIAARRLCHRRVRPWMLGVSANMAARRATLLSLGGFDVRLGAGTPQASGEDLHLSYRVLRGGLNVQLDPASAMLHWGARSLDDGSARRLLTGSWIGLGACYGLLLGDGDPVAGAVYVRELQSLAAASVISLARRERANHLGFLRHAASGFGRGLRLSRLSAHASR